MEAKPYMFIGNIEVIPNTYIISNRMKTIIVQPMGGLCNRMRTIASAVKLAKKLNCKMRLRTKR